MIERSCELCGRVVRDDEDEGLCDACFEGYELGLSPDEAAARSQSLPGYQKAIGWVDINKTWIQ